MMDDAKLANGSMIPSILGSGEGDPYPLYDALRESGGVYRDPQGTWLVAGHALVMQVLRDRDGIFLTQPLGDEFVCARGSFQRHSGGEHARLRDAMAPLFRRAPIESLRSSINREASSLIRMSAAAGEFELSAIALVLAVQTVCGLLGIARRDAATWLGACVSASSFLVEPVVTDAMCAELMPGLDRFMALVRNFVDDVERHGAPDHPIRPLLEFEAQGVLSRDELLDNLVVLFVAGFGTTARAMCGTVVLALQQRCIWEACVKDRGAVSKVVRELMRLDGVAHGVLRYPSRDIELGGQRIGRGDPMLLLLASANRDPHAFVHPETIDLTRSAADNLSFGAGAHACIGRALGMIGVEAVWHALLDTMPAAVLDFERLRRYQGGVVHGYADVWLRSS
ncbi:cytochrome P450 [Paraburkholderia humisilvae]|uniref:Biotin biosynthesis cytochrome P450 n=1 Tax=Paraburkholderia humisilvae TaxID=627669 RepID=A0A6J5EGD3_9BURK|nr:cytochrome P450 [Paraburkholderia humisilvae]CAB3764326.1 Biotin biosynthesis cytochrome P450 [Paraburkholderia humisilvae]